MSSNRVKYLIWSLVAVLVGTGVSLSSYNHNPIGSYLLIAYTIIITIIAMFGKISHKYYPLIILGISGGLVLQTTMYGNSPIGTDIQVEMYFAKDIAVNGWNPSTTHLYNMSIVTIGVVPAMIKIGIDPVWIFKAILPLCLVAIPPILYLVYIKFLNQKQAFIAVLFFMVMPAFSIAIPTIAKQEVAELFLALLVLLMVSKVGTVKKTFGIMGLLLLTFLSHYSVGLVGLCFIVAVWVVTLVKWILSKFNLPTLPFLRQQISPSKCYGVALVVCMLIGGLWATYTGGGKLLLGINNVLNAPISAGLYYTYNPTIGRDMKAFEFMKYQEAPIQTAVGMDFGTSELSGQSFRITQYLTELFIIIGIGTVILGRKRLPAEFVACVGASGLLLGACIFVPQVSKILGIARFYHLTLFFLAPMLVLGASIIAKNKPRIGMSIALVTVLAYFVFTSGLVFELSKSTALDRIDTPYSIALSNNRLNMVGVFTDNDRAAAQWLSENGIDIPIVADDNSLVLLRGYVYPRPRLFNGNDYTPYDITDPPEDSYIFLTEWNIDNDKTVRYIDVGMRMTIETPAGLIDELQNRTVVFQKGDAIVYR